MHCIAASLLLSRFDDFVGASHFYRPHCSLVFTLGPIRFGSLHDDHGCFERCQFSLRRRHNEHVIRHVGCRRDVHRGEWCGFYKPQRSRRYHRWKICQHDSNIVERFAGTVKLNACLLCTHLGDLKLLSSLKKTSMISVVEKQMWKIFLQNKPKRW